MIGANDAGCPQIMRMGLQALRIARARGGRGGQGEADDFKCLVEST